jgi:hypothetical protein
MSQIKSFCLTLACTTSDVGVCTYLGCLPVVGDISAHPHGCGEKKYSHGFFTWCDCTEEELCTMYFVIIYVQAAHDTIINQ